MKFLGLFLLTTIRELVRGDPEYGPRKPPSFARELVNKLQEERGHCNLVILWEDPALNHFFKELVHVAVYREW